MCSRTNDYLIWSILNLILCSLIGGIVCVFFSMKTREHLNAGNDEEASRYSRITLIANIISTIVGVTLIIVLSVYYTR